MSRNRWWKRIRPATSVQRNQEHRLPFELLEDELGIRLAGQDRHEVHAHRVQYRDAKQEFTTFIRLGLEHLLAEVVGDEAVVSAELGDELDPRRRRTSASFPPAAIRRPTLRSGRPDVATLSDARVRPVMCLSNAPESCIVQSQVGLANLCQLVAHPVAAPGDGEVCPGGKDQMKDWAGADWPAAPDRR